MAELDLSKLKYVLFDWDNTLAETRTALVQAVNLVLTEYGLPNWDIVKKRRDPNLSFRDNFSNIFGNENASAAYKRYAEVYAVETPKLLSGFPGVSKVLEFFRRHRIDMMILTNKDRRLLEIELPVLYDPKWFKKVVCGHEASRDKPYPEHIYYALKGFLRPEQITPQNVWVVGDSHQDSNCALAANAQAIRIGSPIWNDGIEVSDKIVYFKDFETFYQFLVSQESSIC